jgi:hypothetical protein
MTQEEALREAESIINLPDIKPQSGKAKQFSAEEIKKAAKDFVNEFFNSKDWEKECPNCKVINCINNDSCISCGLQL